MIRDIDLINHQYGFDPRFAKPVHNDKIKRHASLHSVDDQQNYRCRVDRERDLFFHRIGQTAGSMNLSQPDTTRIHERIVVVDLGRIDIAGDPWLIMNDGDAPPGQAIEESALSDIRPSNEGHDALLIHDKVSSTKRSMRSIASSSVL